MQSANFYFYDLVSLELCQWIRKEIGKNINFIIQSHLSAIKNHNAWGNLQVEKYSIENQNSLDEVIPSQ